MALSNRTRGIALATAGAAGLARLPRSAGIAALVLTAEGDLSSRPEASRS